VALHLLDDHISGLAKKLPALYRRRVLVLMGLLALHLFVVAPFVRLSTDEQRYQDEAASIATRIKHLQAVETDIRRALDQADQQKARLLDDLIGGFKALNDARDDLRAPMEDRLRDLPLQSADQFRDVSGRRAAARAPFAEAVAQAEGAEDKAAAYRDLIHRLILEPAFTQANQRWQDEKTAIAARLKHIRQGLPTEENLQGIEGLLTALDDDVRRHRFRAPEGDWWMTVTGKEAMLDRNLDRITRTLNEAITPLAAGRDKLQEEIEEKKAQLAEARLAKEELAKRAAESFHKIEESLNIAAVDGVQAMTFFPVLLAAALGLMTADICRCLQEIRRCRRKADSGLQAEMVQWLEIAARPPYLLQVAMAVWILLAALHVRPLNPDRTLYGGQILLAAVVLAAVAIWEAVARRLAMAEIPVDESADVCDEPE
jgi:hypothetical protein